MDNAIEIHTTATNCLMYFLSSFKIVVTLYCIQLKNIFIESSLKKTQIVFRQANAHIAYFGISSSDMRGRCLERH